MNGGESLPETLQAVAEGVLVAAGFQAAVINYMRSDGVMEVMSVAGPPDVRDALLGVQFRPEDLLREMAQAEHWGELRFIPHGTFPAEGYAYVPDIPVPSSPDGWYPGDDLLAPLYSTSGELIGILSVDMPTNGLRPDTFQRQLLELLASQAAIAINNARLTQRLRASETSFRLAFDAVSSGMALVSLDPRTPLHILQANAALTVLAVELTGAPASSLSGLLDATDEDHDPHAWCTSMAANPGRTHVAKRVTTTDGHRWLEITSSVLPLLSSEAGQAIVQVEDVTDRREAELEAARAATRDPLTGLRNRSDLFQRLTHITYTCRENHTVGAVFFCDLNGFKQINDNYGHQAGDAVLIACAGRLAGQVRAGDHAYRVGGDEFVILLENIDPWELETVAQRVKTSIAAPLRYDGELFNLSISVGWALIDGHSHDVARILAAADGAMYADKRANLISGPPAQRARSREVREVRETREPRGAWSDPATTP
ncbi:MAG: diguanylate cyclase [Actinomycetota bacterium]|nr:diguanylate cyclase [Actinomycetota bacterium]